MTSLGRNNELMTSLRRNNEITRISFYLCLHATGLQRMLRKNGYSRNESSQQNLRFVYQIYLHMISQPTWVYSEAVGLAAGTPVHGGGGGGRGHGGSRGAGD